MASPLQAALDHIILAATELDIHCSLAREGEYIAEYASASECLKQLATGLRPDVPCWPEGGAEIYTLEIEKRKRQR
jgi:hypothetical protein